MDRAVTEGQRPAAPRCRRLGEAVRALVRGGAGLLAFVVVLAAGAALVLIGGVAAALGLVVALALAPVAGLAWVVVRIGRGWRPGRRPAPEAAWPAPAESAAGSA